MLTHPSSSTPPHLIYQALLYVCHDERLIEERKDKIHVKDTMMTCTLQVQPGEHPANIIAGQPSLMVQP
jgi:hypothetical protein